MLWGPSQNTKYTREKTIATTEHKGKWRSGQQLVEKQSIVETPSPETGLVLSRIPPKYTSHQNTSTNTQMCTKPSLSSHKTLKLGSEQQTSVGTKIHALPNDNWNVQSKCQLQP